MEFIYDFSQMTEDEICAYFREVEQNRVSVLNEIERRKNAHKRELIKKLEELFKEMDELNINITISDDYDHIYLGCNDLFNGHFNIKADY